MELQTISAKFSEQDLHKSLLSVPLHSFTHHYHSNCCGAFITVIFPKLHFCLRCLLLAIYSESNLQQMDYKSSSTNTCTDHCN